MGPAHTQGTFEEQMAWWNERMGADSWLPCRNDALGRPTAAMDVTKYAPSAQNGATTLFDYQVVILILAGAGT